MDYHFRPAKYSEVSQIWQILKDAIKRRKKDGSNQWQDGYPNMEVVKSDIENKRVITTEEGRELGKLEL
jgi:hypothetical protein